MIEPVNYTTIASSVYMHSGLKTAHVYNNKGQIILYNYNAIIIYSYTHTAWNHAGGNLSCILWLGTSLITVDSKSFDVRITIENLPILGSWIPMQRILSHYHCYIQCGLAIYIHKAWPRGMNPSWPHTTFASRVVQDLSHTVPQALLMQTSTLPSAELYPLTSLTSPSLHRE